jgi:hypothetical protein
MWEEITDVSAAKKSLLSEDLSRIPRRDFPSVQSHQLQHSASAESQAAMGELLLDGLKRGLQPGEEKVIEFWKLHGKQAQQRDKHEGSQAHPEVQPQLARLCIGDSA